MSSTKKLTFIEKLRDWKVRKAIIQTVLIGLFEALILFILTRFYPGIQVASFRDALLAVIVYGIMQTIFWHIFVRFLARVHPLLYPLLNLVVGVIFVLLVGTIVPGFVIEGFWNALIVIIYLTITSTIAAILVGMDDDAWFDFNVTQNMVKRYGKPDRTDAPGYLFLEIDGLSYDIFMKALDGGYMPFLKSWLDSGSHKVTQWETDFSAQTAAMQAGILLGDNTGIAAYRWWDRDLGRVVNSANPKDAQVNESKLTNHDGLLAHGGTSRGNMFSGDADENLFTYSTLFDKKRGSSPNFYLFLLSPYIVVRLLTKFFLEVFYEAWDGGKAWIMNVRPRVTRIFPYGLLRAFMNSLLPELVMYTTISDVMRGVPASYVLFAGYDDLGHFSGIDRPDSMSALSRTDSHFARIVRAVEQAPRPYHVIILSDHGQSEGVCFRQRYGITLKDLVQNAMKDGTKVYAQLESNEGQDLVNTVLTDASRQNLKSSEMLNKALKKDMNEDSYVNMEALATDKEKNTTAVQDADVVVLASGCIGMVCFKDAKKRLTLEEINERSPGLVEKIAEHEGVGYVLVDSAKGAVAIGGKGKYYLQTDTIEGENPLAPYGKNAAMHLKRASSFHTAPDIVINTAYDPKTGEIAGFEEQVGHHGGLGGMQNRPFLMYPSELSVPDEPIVGSYNLYKVLHGWRKSGK